MGWERRAVDRSGQELEIRLGCCIIVIMSGKVNSPWDVLALRRKLKRYEKYGFTESMKNLHKLRSLGLDKKMIIAT